QSALFRFKRTTLRVCVRGGALPGYLLSARAVGTLPGGTHGRSILNACTKERTRYVESSLLCKHLTSLCLHDLGTFGGVAYLEAHGFEGIAKLIGAFPVAVGAGLVT